MAKKQSTLGKAASAVKGAATSVGKAVGIIGGAKRSTRKKSTTKKTAAKKPAAKSSAKKK